MSPRRVVESQFAAAAQEVGQLPPPVQLEIAFAGRSNVGKSSLLNSLTGRRNLVRTSSTPGCTRKIGFYEVRLDNGMKLTFVDLPGYGYAKRSKTERSSWADLIENYLLSRPTLAAAAVLVDARRGVEDDDADLLRMLQEPAPNRRPVGCLVVATKLDRLKRAEQKLALNAVRCSADIPVVGYSIRESHYRQALLERLLDIGGLTADPADT